jgi:hypothetical protein
MTSRQGALVCLTASMLMLSPGLMAETAIYKSIGKDGAVTYSSKPPADAVEVQPVEVTPGPAAEDQAQALERTAEQKKLADELAEARKQREAERAEARQAQQAPAEVQLGDPSEKKAEPDYRPYGYGWPYYVPYPIHRPDRPGYGPIRPRPEHYPAHSPLPSPPPMPSPPPLPSGLEWPGGRGIR